jgi:hypothetical protein
MNKQKLFALLKKLNTTPPLSDLDFYDLIDDFITEVNAKHCPSFDVLLRLATEQKEHFLLILNTCGRFYDQLAFFFESERYNFKTFKVISDIIQQLERIDDSMYDELVIDFLANVIVKLPDTGKEPQFIGGHKTALIIALMQVKDKPILRKFLAKLTPMQKRKMNKISTLFRISGTSAFQRLGINHLSHPYHPNQLMGGI